VKFPDLPGDVEHSVVGESDRPLDAEHVQLLPTCEQFLLDGGQVDV
jgi:hypothetical protein